MKNFYSWYYNFFSIKEIENSEILKLLFYVLIFSFFVTFNIWIGSNAVTIGNYINGTQMCPPYFQSCGEYFFLEKLPFYYTQETFYVFLYVLLLFGVFSAYKKNWVMAHGSLLIPFIWKVMWIFLFTYGTAGNFDYYDLVLAFAFLFLKEKEYFVKLLFVLFYFLSSTIKIHEGWIFGNYFKTLVSGMPFIPDKNITFFTNILIFMQMVGSWFLLSNNKALQRLAFVYFSFFHIYSGIIVHFRYITISLTALIALFAIQKDWKIMKVSKNTLAGYLLISFLIFGQLSAYFVTGDQKKTLESDYFGFYMFEANHQCVSTTKIYYLNKIVKNLTNSNYIANNRCDPYHYWYRIKTICDRDSNIEKVSWTFDHSINGHKFERIVDVENACGLDYKVLKHNSWIKLDGESEILDQPVYKNGYLYSLPEKIKIPSNSYTNEKLLGILEKFYWLIWLSVLFFLCTKLFASKK